MSGATLAFDIIAKDRASNTFDKVGKSSSTMGDKLKHAAKVGVAAVGAAALVGGAALVSMAKAAMQDQAAQAILAKQLKNSAGATREQVAATEDWITKQGIALGVTDDDLRPALSKLVAVTHDVGKAQGLASLAMNVSAGTGKSLSTVSAALAKAQLGQVSGLSKLGVATKNADGSTRSLKDITADMAKTYDGAASTAANTASGKFGRLKLIFDETKESIGSKLLPILTQLATWFLTKAVPAISRFVSGMQDGTGAGGKFAAILGKVWGVTKKVFGFIIDNKEAVATFAGVILAVVAATKAWAAVQVLLNTSMFASPLGLIVLAVAALAAGIVYAYKKSETFRTIVQGAFDGVNKAVTALGKVGTWLWNSVFQPVFKFIAVGVSALLDLFGDLLGALGHVPGFGWAKDAAASLHDAADATKRLSDNIKKIPDKTVRINVVQTVTTRGDFTGNSLGGHTPYLQTGQGPI